jgi:hypothetical protein
VRVDTANNALRNIAPIILAYGVDYEKSYFNKKLKNNTLDLTKTGVWISKNVVNLLSSKDARVRMEDLAQGWLLVSDMFCDALFTCHFVVVF